MKIALFIPVHNEAETLSTLLDRVPKTLQGYGVDLVVVDDGSRDGSAVIARRFTDQVISLTDNRGVGYATKIGLQHIVASERYEYVLKFDGDGQHAVDHLEFMLSQLIHSADIVVCSRFHPSSDQSATPVDRLILNRLFADIMSRITGWQVTDARSGYMGFRTFLLRDIADAIIVERYGIPMELLLRIWAKYPRVRHKEIPHHALYHGRISGKLMNKYETEVMERKVARVTEAYHALLRVLDDLNVTTEELLGTERMLVQQVG